MLYLAVTNDGTGDEITGNYRYKVGVNQKILHEGRFDGFDRRKGWHSLLEKIVTKIGKDLEEFACFL